MSHWGWVLYLKVVLQGNHEIPVNFQQERVSKKSDSHAWLSTTPSRFFWVKLWLLYAFRIAVSKITPFSQKSGIHYIGNSEWTCDFGHHKWLPIMQTYSVVVSLFNLSWLLSCSPLITVANSEHLIGMKWRFLWTVWFVCKICSLTGYYLYMG